MPTASANGDSGSSRTVYPVLPPELERRIFLLAAQTSDRGVAIRLLLVAFRVNAWIEPYLYKTIILHRASQADQLLVTLSNRPSVFARTHIKALCITPSIELGQTIELLTVCAGLESLALWLLPRQAAAVLTARVAALPLARLSLNVMTLLPLGHSELALQHHPAFQRLTHLDIVNNWVLWKSSLGVEHLARLTHVAFRFWSRGYVQGALAPILEKSPPLEVLVLLADAVVVPGARVLLEEQDIRDERVVVLRHVRDLDEWEAMGREGMGMWQRAEIIVKWRRRCRAGPFDFPPGSDEITPTKVT